LDDGLRRLSPGNRLRPEARRHRVGLPDRLIGEQSPIDLTTTLIVDIL
jgi:hypothetical protein